MNKTAITTLIIVGAIFLVIGGWFVSTQRGLVEKSEVVKESWSNVETQYQRRFDLIPNLVETVKQYMSYEKETFQAVVEARQLADKAKESGLPSDYAKADAQVKQVMTEIGVVVESYPELKANESVNNLMLELAGTENRIATARENYNSDARKFNTAIKKFPTVVVAGMFGYSDEFEYIKADAGAEKAPKINFN